MEKFEIVVLPEVLNFIDKLPLILIQEGYLSTYENALRFAEDIISFMEQIPQSDSFQLEEIAKQHFSFLGDDLKYSLFRRKSSPQTTWYIFFSQKGNRFIIKYITNNHFERQFIR